jgi:hypothetical protein
MTKRGEDTTLGNEVDRSGFPFQLAVERELRIIGRRHDWEVAATEVPVGDSFADIVLQRPGFLAVVECKRVDANNWCFLVPRGASVNVVGCRVEWHNPRALKPPAFMAGIPISKVFTSDCTMCEGSYESSVSVLPRKNAAHSLEPLARDLLNQTHALGDTYGLKYGAGPTYLIPVIVTNASLSICEYDPASLDLQYGRLGSADFRSAEFVRFRKALVTERSNDYDRHDLPLAEWAADRARTVFIVSPSGLERFLSGFRAFGLADGNEYPPEFVAPPSP